MQQGFIFDLNKCVGCHACVVACQIENGTDQHTPWREITTFNSFQHPDLPVFHYSLACNHCEDAPCMNSCPALAYTQDEGLNTIIYHANRCIGCKYCTWACPYDAPKFVHVNGVVEKCTSCQHRLEADQKPACANLCPTGALDYKEIDLKEQLRLPGFTEIGIRPGIEVIRLRTQKPPRTVVHLGEKERTQYKNLELRSSSKISLKNEWVLVFFTMLVPSLTALMASASLEIFTLNPYYFLGAGFVGLFLSSVHLGKKTRAWRSVLNIKKSWLSREILGYGLFLGSAFVWFIIPEYKIIAYSSTLFGFATSYVIDKVYTHVEKTTALEVHSSSVFLTALLLTSLMTSNLQFTGLILGIKFLLYLYRKIYFIIHRRKINAIISILRIATGFILPVVLWFNFNELNPGWIFSMIIAGEIIDRIEFYLESEIITPKRQMIRDNSII